MRSLSPDILLTFIRLNRQAKMPLYIQLYQQIKDGVFDGLLKHGDRMPSTRSLSQELSVSRNCVLLAFEQLTLEGFLTSKVGAGTYVCEQLNELKATTKKLESTIGKLAEDDKTPVVVPLYSKFVAKHTGQESLVPFQPSVPSFADFPFRVWAKIAASVYKNIHQLHLGYDSAQGYLPLRQALTDYLRINRSINCSAEQIVIVNGSSQALNLISELLLKKGDLCWMEDPGYLWAKSAFSRFGGEICPVPITSSGLDLDYAVRKFPGAKLAYVTPSHQYPLGETMPLAERIKLLKIASQQNIWVIEDDYESEFRYVGRPIPALKGLDSFGKVIFLGNVNKSLFPALRIGYIVLPSVVMAKQIAMIKAITDRQSPVIDQAILTNFIMEGHFLRHLRRMKLVYKKAQQELISLLYQYFGLDIRISAADAGMHLVVWFLKDEVTKDITHQAKEYGMNLYAIDELAIKFKHPAALMMGFTGFKKEMMEQAVINLKKILST
ncbi:MocR-like pyridoxine biosynthesis transcription factor PdxR [Pedobacter sp. NJ-S-72]